MKRIEATRLFVLVMALFTLSSIAFGLTYDFEGTPKDVYYNPINISYNQTDNTITADTNFSYKITNAISYGVVDQTHYVNVSGGGIKLVYFNAETEKQSVYESFKYFKKVCVDKRVNKTHTYDYLNNVSESVEVREYVVEEGSINCDWVEGNSWNSTGEFKVTYKTPIIASGKVDITVCVNDQCETIDPWYDSNYNYKMAITIDKDNILSALTNFPVLVRLNSSNFNFSRTQADGDDIRFINGSENTALDYETVSYDQAGQTAEIYVEIPSIGVDDDTVFYMYYGYASATSGSAPNNVWDSNYVGVYHLQSDASSSTGGITLTVTGATQVSGSGCYMGGCYSFDGNGDTLWSSTVMGLNKADSGRTCEVFWNASSVSGSRGLCDYFQTVGHGVTETVSDGSITNFQMYVNSGWYLAQDTNDVTTNLWYSSVNVYDRDNTTVQYKNGAQTATSGDMPNTDITEAGPIAKYVTFGNNADDTTDYAGYMDEFRVSKIDRSNAWLKATYKTMSQGLQTYGAEDVSDTTPTVTINNLANTTLYNNFPSYINFSVTGDKSNYTCTLNINNNVTYLGSVNNNTNTNWGIVKTDLLNKVNVTCLSLSLNGTSTLYFTNIAHNTTYQSVSSAYENTAYLFNLTVYANSDLINLSSVQSNFTFNNTVYYPDSRVQGISSVSFTKSVTTPYIELYNVTKANYWLYNFTYVNTTIFNNGTTSTNTLIYTAWIGNCSTIGISTLNFSFINEKTSVPQDAFMDSIFQFDNKNYTFNYQNDTNFTFCLYPNWLNTTINAQLSYYNTGYAARLYYLINNRVDNVTDNINLYMLADASATSTTIRVVNTDGLGVSNISVVARREYVGLGAFLAVATCVTDNNGYCGMALEWATPRYDFQVVNSSTGAIIKTTLPITITSSNHPIQINIDTGNLYNYWENRGNVLFNYTFINDSMMVNFTVNAMDTSGSATGIKLECYKLGVTGRTLLYSEVISGYSASLTCELGNTTNNNYYMITTIYLSTPETFTVELSNPYSITTSLDGLFIVIILIAVVTLAGLFNPTVSIIFMVLGLIIISFLNFTMLSLAAIIPLVVSGLIISYVLRDKGGSY